MLSSTKGDDNQVDAGVIAAETAVSIRNVVKTYGTGPSAVLALKGATLDIASGEFFTLLGPSGCGKTTLLRLIGGFQDTTSGSILIDGEDIAGLPANRRPVNTVFQNYALFPHMSVRENIAFGLKRLRQPASQVAARTDEMIALTHLDAFADRRPSQLSGGQQQRVALARALAPSPKVLLLDEPLSALDLKLRQAMREELKRIQQETGITFIFVTHDQEEALTMSDRIAVMSAGEIQQIGSPREIYEEPGNRFVADFIGETNLIDVDTEAAPGERAGCLCWIGPDVSVRCAVPDGFAPGGPATLSVRPERISLVLPDPSLLTGTVDRLVYLGTDTQYVLRLESEAEISVRAQNAHNASVPFNPGDRASVRLDDGAARLLVS